MAFASIVGEYRPPLRLNSLTPTDISACFIARLTPGDDTLSSRAAPPTVPVTMMARMISLWRSVNMCWLVAGLLSAALTVSGLALRASPRAFCDAAGFKERETRMFDTYGGATRIYPILGDPIAQAKSPGGLTRAFRLAGHDAIVVPLQVKPEYIGQFLRMLTDVANVDGIVATVPHKFAAFAHAASATARAHLIGSANILRRRPEGGWHADMFVGLCFVLVFGLFGGVFVGFCCFFVGVGG